MRRTSKLAEAPLTEYDKLRVQNLVSNNRMLQSLGIHALASIVRNSSAKNTRRAEPHEDSGSEYDPKEDEGTEEDKIDDSLVEENDVLDVPPSISTTTPQKVCKKRVKRTVKKPSKNTSKMPPGGTRPPKRVVACMETVQPARVTRQRTKELTTAQSDDGQEEVLTGTSRKVLNHETIPQLGDEIGATPSSTTPDPCDSTDFPTEHDEQIQMDDEDTNVGNRGHNKGRGLERISRGLCTKIPIHIAEGKRRPEAPMQAAKLASEGGIILRQHVPILPHWKEYKRDKSHLTNYIGKVAAQFTMDTSSNAVQNACNDMLKGGQRQMRYRIKKKFFDNVSANEVSTTSPVTWMKDQEWQNLVQMWSSSKHKNTSEKNKHNRSKVQFQQRTRSRSYIAHCHVIKEKYKAVEPTAIDIFKECHNSKRIGFSEPVKDAIAEMEAIIDQPVPDGQDPKSATTVVSEVLTKLCPTTKFLQNVGLQSASKNSSRGGVASHVKDLETKLEVKNQAAEQMQEKLCSQQQELDVLKKRAEEAEAASNKHLAEIEFLKKTEDNEAMLL